MLTSKNTLQSSIYLLFILLAGFAPLNGQTNKSYGYKLNQAFINEQLSQAVTQYKTLRQHLPKGVFPRTYEHDSLLVSKSNSWISGFYPGTLWYLYEFSGDESLRKEAESRMKDLEKEQYNKGTHDLGFMLYCSFGNGLRLTGNSHYQEVLLQGATSLISRFNPQVGCIRSWDHHQEKWEFPVIIDNMMNLELLNWANRVSNNERYAEIARTHANTTLKNHFRQDNSSYHVVDYATATGAIRHKQTAQGAFDESAWARGQAWGLYGYTMMYRDTRHEAYLQQAMHIASYLMNHPNLPSDKIPYWDYNAKDIPNSPRDASAAAISASALLELSTYAPKDTAAKYVNFAEQIIQQLASPTYRAAIGTNGGFLLKHSVGNLPGNSEVDVPLSYADYYYVEALMRYRNLSKKNGK
uniref:Glycosyl hydrolase family 88 n=1 Tax=Sphingobacterium sp. (strain 21) TaxID=743722 RepID=F4CAG8_SPHS2